MNTELNKRLTMTTWATLALGVLLMAAALVGTQFRPSVPAKQAELARFEAMPAHLDWKPTALSLIESRQRIVEVGFVGLWTVMGVAAVSIVLAAANLAWLRRVTQVSREITGG